MAQVFDACDERLQRRVAVKILRPDAAALPGMCRRFQQEARLAARLVHPNIVAVLDYGEDGSCNYLVMERLSGATLRDEIATGPLNGQRVVRVLTETLSALSTAHRAGVLHRDIKPSNILMEDDGFAKISDFGIAKSMDVYGDAPTSEETITGVVLGTPGYLAPERRAGIMASVESDLYSVGAVMMEALTGRVPTEPAAIVETLPPAFREVARRSLASDPANRYHSAVEMLQAIRHPRTEPMTVYAEWVTHWSCRFVRRSPHGGHRQTSHRPGVGTSSGDRPTASPVRRRRMIGLVLACAVTVVLGVVLLVALDPGALQPSTATLPKTPHAQVSTDRGTAPTTAADPVAEAIRAEARQLASGGLPGDAALAVALEDAADQPAGPDRQAAAQRDLELGQVLVDSGGIERGRLPGHGRRPRRDGRDRTHDRRRRRRPASRHRSHPRSYLCRRSTGTITITAAATIRVERTSRERPVSQTRDQSATQFL